MNNKVAKLLYIGIQKYRDEPVVEKIDLLNKTQWLNVDEIKAMQLEKLREMLKYAMNTVPYYKKAFSSYANVINNLSSIDQISELPFITKHIIQSNYSKLKSENYTGKFSVESTSGSTGDPFKFILDRNASAFIRALSYREHMWYGLDIGAKEARFYGIPMDPIPKIKEMIKDFLMNRKRFTVFDLSDDVLKRYYRIIDKYKPEYIYGYTSSVVEFISFMKRNKLKFSTPFLKAIIVTSEVLYDEDRKLMESYLQVPVVNEYGTSELGIIAAQCPDGGMHISAENVVVEIVRNGKTVEYGEEGEVILTGLNNFAMPLIRYRVGDVARMSNKRCKCGRGLPLMENVEGRVNNMVVTPEGKIASGLVFYYISRSLIERDSGIKKFKVIQDALDHVIFQIVKGPGFKDDNLKVLEKKTHEYLSPKMNVSFEFCDNIPHTTSGKIIHFISKIGSPYHSN
jgi:phenylacetate-CoA ligase